MKTHLCTRLLIRSLFLVALLLPGIAQFVPAPPPNGKPRTVEFHVVDSRTGDVLEFLRPNDFVVLDNGQPRRVQSVRVESHPIDLIFVLSRYIRRPPNGSADAYMALRRAVTKLRGTDRAAVTWIDAPAKGAPTLSSDRETTIRALSSDQELVHFWKPKPSLELYDAVSLASARFPEQTEEVRLRAIVAVTVDAERGSTTTLSSLIKELVERKIVLSAVILDRREDSRPVSAAPIPGVPRDISIGGTSIVGESLLPAIVATGGESVQELDVLETLPRLIRGLQQGYRLSFESWPLDNEGHHVVEVRLSDETLRRFPNAVVRVRPLSGHK